MFQKFLIDNAIKIFTTFVSLLVAAGVWIGRNEMEISDLKRDVSEHKIVIKNYDKLINEHQWYMTDFQNRIIYLERQERENKK